MIEQATGCTKALEECTADDVDEVGEIKMSHKEIDQYLQIRNAGNALTHSGEFKKGY